MMKLTVLALLFFVPLLVHARTRPDTLAIIHAGQACSIRGMSIQSDRVVWISGSNGHVARSTDAGKTWNWMVVPGYEQTDFRDIHAFDAASAIIMGVGNPAHILKTKDGGKSWKAVYTRNKTGMFLDAMDFRNEVEGICIGDPIDAGGGRSVFFVLRTIDGGDTWSPDSSGKLPAAKRGEALFSASGTNIALLNSKEFDYAFISGGSASNLYLIGRGGRPGKVYPLRMIKGGESTGAFSMATDRRKRFYCIGGDYKVPDAGSDNFVWTTDRGESWKIPAHAPPTGYRSCIRIINRDRMVACGPNGVDMCRSPEKWRRISSEGFNVCMVSPNRKLVFFGGEKGRIGMLKL